MSNSSDLNTWELEIGKDLQLPSFDSLESAKLFRLGHENMVNKSVYIKQDNIHVQKPWLYYTLNPRSLCAISEEM